MANSDFKVFKSLTIPAISATPGIYFVKNATKNGLYVVSNGQVVEITQLYADASAGVVINAGGTVSLSNSGVPLVKLAQDVIDVFDSKVDKVSGKGLSPEEFTLAEKQKLAALVSSHFKGLYATKVALEAAFQSSDLIAGDFANVDEGIGKKATTYIWDADDSIWVAQLGEANVETAESVKQKYESNADTNAFTDAYLNKLVGIEAQANKITVVNDFTSSQGHPYALSAGMGKSLKDSLIVAESDIDGLESYAAAIDAKFQYSAEDW